MLSEALKRKESIVAINENSLPDVEERFDSILRKARLINSHLLLENGIRVAHITYDDGRLTYALAYTNPDYLYIGILNSKEDVQKTKEKYSLPNLGYISGDKFGKENDVKYDAIIAVDILYRIYNFSNYSQSKVTEFISRCFDGLKTGGQLLIRDYSLVNPNNSVVLELPCYKNNTADIDIFLKFKSFNSDLKIEEIKTGKTYIRSFSMPYKIAYDFILGKDKKELRKQSGWQIIAFSTQEYLDLIEQYEGRVLYMSPYRDEPYIRENFQERFKLYSDTGIDLGFPPTSFFILIQKSEQNQSLYLYEKEKLEKKLKNLSISSVVDDTSGSLFEVVRSHTQYADILPYKITKAGKLNIFLTESVPHGIANTNISKDYNLDHRQWSGHMIDAVKLEADEVLIYKEQGEHEVRQLIYDKHGILTASGSELETGPALYPAPDYIDELRECYYIEVCKNYDCSQCLEVIKTSQINSKSRPKLKELDAQKVLKAIHVGLIPSTILETQIVYLMKLLSVTPERTSSCACPSRRRDSSSCANPDADWPGTSRPHRAIAAC